MNIIYNSVFLAHDTGNHPENRRRLESFDGLEETDIPDGLDFLPLVHSREYIERVKRACEKSEQLDSDTRTSPGSFTAATKSVGAAVLASQSEGFALVRPPGHHAYPDRSGGFCLFNTIAVAARKLVNEGNNVLIFDFDGHLGDGTESIFYSQKNVLYISFHQSDAYPGGGSIDELGDGPGSGFTVNVPFTAGSGDDVYLQALSMVIPIIEQFNPAYIGFSAGFDGYQKDPLLRLRLSLNTFWEIGSRFRKFQAKKFAVLEGGYNAEMLPKCVGNFLAGINGKPQLFTEDATETLFLEMEEMTTRLGQLKDLLSPYWRL